MCEDEVVAGLSAALFFLAQISAVSCVLSVVLSPCFNYPNVIAYTLSIGFEWHLFICLLSALEVIDFLPPLPPLSKMCIFAWKQNSQFLEGLMR